MSEMSEEKAGVLGRVFVGGGRAKGVLRCMLLGGWLLSIKPIKWEGRSREMVLIRRSRRE
jgi:hypothetical protein